MNTTKYEVGEQDEDAREDILASLVDNPTQGIAYMCLKSSGPMSPADIIQSLALSDSWFTSRFDNAVKELAVRGLIQEVAE